VGVVSRVGVVPGVLVVVFVRAVRVLGVRIRRRILLSHTGVTPQSSI
jgi:hypothetical protein